MSGDDSMTRGSFHLDSKTAACRARQCMTVLFVVAVFAIPLQPAEAQIVSGDPSSVSQRFTYLAWTMKGDTMDLTVTQWVVPITLKAAFAEDWELAVFSAATGSDANWDVENGDITGLADSRVQLSRSLADDQVLISAGVSLPTGETELSRERRQLIPWLSADFFNFPVKYPGEGLNLFGEIGFALPAGAWVWGATGAVHYAGEYTPFDDGRDYQPGTRLVGMLGAERVWPQRGRFGADILVVQSTDDKVDGDPVFADGTQLDVRLTGRREFSDWHIEAAGRAIVRGKNKVKAGKDQVDLVREESNTNGNDYRFYLSGRATLSPTAQGWATFDARLLAANEYDEEHALFEDAARIFGIGGGVDFSLSDRAVAGLGLRLWTGSSDGAATFEAIDLTGFEILERLTITF